MSADQKFLAVIYSAGRQGHVAVFPVDADGDLGPLATSESIDVSSFSGVAFSE